MSYKLFNTFIIFISGFILGIISKIFDIMDLELIHNIFLYLDLGAFFSRMSIWLLFALIISVYSKTPLRAAINVFLFFVGMLISYYGYGYIIQGIFPKKVIFFWYILAVISPLLAIPCWYAKGKGYLSIFISSVILSIFFILAFYFDINGFHLRHYGMEAINWIIAIIMLYNNPKQFIKIMILSISLGILIRCVYLKYLIGKINFWVVQL